jgi:hypothetical protein
MIPDHSEHCRRCKEQVRQLLTAIYGDCLAGYSFSWPTRPEEYKKTIMEDTLQQILMGLEQLRGYRDFIKSSQLPPCDFYIPNPPFILEFDESQHFTQARHVTLSLYQPEFKVGFPISQWLELCSLIDARDNDPPDRDERRAWYDTLRDLVPMLHGLKPTVRIYSNEFRWCSLDSGSKRDQERFCSILKQRLENPAHSIR